MEAKAIIGYLIGYLVIVAMFYPFVGGMAFFYALGLLAMMGLQAFFVWIWTRGAKDSSTTRRPPDS
jgi:hypothetical protein